MAKIFIVIAAYNEENSIGSVLDSLRKEGYRDIVVVDDGSSDRTYKVALRHRAKVLSHPFNRGQGAALKTGIDYALQEGADVIVTFDADGQHNPKNIKAMIAPVLKKEVDITLGSRYLKQSKTNVPIIRKYYHKMGVLAIWLMYGIRLTDAHNGLRALSRKAAEAIEIKSDRMEHASEIVDQIGKRHLRFREIPVEIRYTEYSLRHGQSSTNAFNILSRMIFKKLVR
jgi:glycosyltransferase involved in cell wall biosynthesis